MAMAMRKMSARYIPRRFSSGGRILGEEEKAAENVYIKKIEKEKLEKLARQGPKPEEKAAHDMKTNGSASGSGSGSTSSTSKISTDNYRNYAVVAGVVTALAGFGWWYRGSKGKKTEEVQD